MQFYSVYIMKDSGVPIYYRSFSNIFEDTEFSLISSFFGAIIQFSDAIVKERMNVLEMGKLRFFFRYEMDNIYILITSNDVSILFIRDRLERMVMQFNNLCNIQAILDSCKVCDDPKVHAEMDKIVEMQDDYSDHRIISIKNVFEKEIYSGDIQGGALLSLKGDIFYCSLPMEDLHNALREIEIRTQAEMRELSVNPKFIWQSGDKMIFSQAIAIGSFNAPVYVVLLFNSRTSLGMADFCLEEMCKKISDHSAT